ncbi:pyridoxamine 5'-phosphate oxidase family protein [Nocardioides abyssi]|uniref:PPOX class F420-dependent oxidoreductase n=1 Tax=Nocardioides abyssi TaxID=3058370 RepID=A0ABT8EP76_9ACTN|nr:PPOX class F420-dependent oxidoreductase [Nocardioides abyssi]MDN4159919.1 PPOX class F420-dependent oxidoreductase [Nocardioides abyssi]
MTSWSPASSGLASMPPALAEMWTERHLCTLTSLRPDGRPHVVPVGCALDLEQECAWVITGPDSRKARNLRSPGAVAICQVDGARWSTLEGTAVVTDRADDVARAVERYASRYRQPRENPERVALRISVDRLLGSRGLF